MFPSHTSPFFLYHCIIAVLFFLCPCFFISRHPFLSISPSFLFSVLSLVPFPPLPLSVSYGAAKCVCSCTSVPSLPVYEQEMTQREWQMSPPLSFPLLSICLSASFPGVAPLYFFFFSPSFLPSVSSFFLFFLWFALLPSFPLVLPSSLSTPPPHERRWRRERWFMC